MIGKPSITAIILNWKRYRNLPKIVNRLKQSSTNMDIWIWNNNPKKQIEPIGLFKDCTIVNSSENFKCPARHALSMLGYSDYILFIDDDILPDKSLPSTFLDVAVRCKFSVMGVVGVRVNKVSPYTNPIHKCHSELYQIETITEVDYVKGRIMFVRREHMRHLWSYQYMLSKDEFYEDDISLNFSIQIATNLPSYVLPGRLFENLEGYNSGLHVDWDTFSRKSVYVGRVVDN